MPCVDMKNDVKNSRVVKGMNFVNLKDAGDPVENAAFYESEGAEALLRWGGQGLGAGPACGFGLPLPNPEDRSGQGIPAEQGPAGQYLKSSLKTIRAGSPAKGESALVIEKGRRRPTLPRSLPRSTIGAEELNDRVRDGNGCGLLAETTAPRGLTLGGRKSGLAAIRARAGTRSALFRSLSTDF